MTMLVNEYCAIVSKGADFEDPRLEALRERMSHHDVERAADRLDDESADREASTLRAWGRQRRMDA